MFVGIIVVSTVCTAFSDVTTASVDSLEAALFAATRASSRLARRRSREGPGWRLCCFAGGDDPHEGGGLARLGQHGIQGEHERLFQLAIHIEIYQLKC